MYAASFEARPRSAAAACSAITAAFSSALTSVPNATAGVVFCSGSASTQLEEVATELRRLVPEQMPVVLVSGPGVLTERGEIENETAATGLVLAARKPTLLASNQSPVDEHLICGHLQNAAHQPALLFIRSEGFEPDALWRVRREIQAPWVSGAGTHGSPGIVCLSAGRVAAASLALMTFDSARPVIKTAHSCRLLHPPMPITRCENGMVLELDGRPALSTLRKLGSGLGGQPLLFTVLAEGNAESWQELLVRGIQGIDPDRDGLLVGKEVRQGALMTFGVRDAGAARDELASICRGLRSDLAGADPRFAFYFNCSGRGRSLHDAANVDTRLIRERFPKLPLAGFQSAFEIAPFAGSPALQLYTGVLSVFGSPS